MFCTHNTALEPCRVGRERGPGAAVAQARTRRIESEKNACAYKFATLRTDMEEEFQTRVKYLQELTSPKAYSFTRGKA